MRDVWTHLSNYPCMVTGLRARSSHATISLASKQAAQLKSIERSAVSTIGNQVRAAGVVSIDEPRLIDDGVGVLALALALGLGIWAVVIYFIFIYSRKLSLLARPAPLPLPIPLHPLPMSPSPPIVVSFFALSILAFLPSVSASGADPIVFPDPSPEAFRALSVLVSLLGTASFPHLAFL